MADMQTAILITLDPQHEGGFQDNPKDRANWTSGVVGVGALVGTKYGITTLDMPGVSIKDLTPEQAIAFYEKRYWNPFYSQIKSQDLANKLFDFGVLFGIGTAVKILQTVLDQVPDGNFGPITLAHANSVAPSGILAEYKIAMKAHAAGIAAANPNDAPDLPDWERRIDS